jgi:hypothetical protein
MFFKLKNYNFNQKWQKNGKKWRFYPKKWQKFKKMNF